MRNAVVAYRVGVLLVVIALCTAAGSRIIPVNAATIALVYLLVILFVATRWGLTEAIIGSVVSTLCFNFYFLPPVGTWTIADPENWVALVTYLATSITASRLSVQARERTLEATARREEMERLYALSRAILLTDPTRPVARQLTNHVARSFEIRAVALYDRATGELHRSGPEDFPGLDQQFRQSAMEGTQFQSSDKVITAIRLGSEPVGSIGISRGDLSDSALQGLVNLVAIGMESARAQQAASRAEAARQSDELKSTLLDAIAHEFKTPLTTIKVSTTTLLSSGPLSGEQQRDFISLVDEEADRLSSLVTDAIAMARLESGRMQVHLEHIDMAELIRRVVSQMKLALEDHSVELRFAGDLPAVPADPALIELVLRQLLGNAAKYSGSKGRIEIRLRREENELVVTVQDRGPGIPASDLPRVFEKFYRAANTRLQVPGAGLGLHIAREIVEAHSGQITVESAAGQGACFRIQLPLAGQGVPL
ncbi:MAG: DUF4118 domain-containing protein [Acidobacteria bacterium]|nr:DUF4118 domain-containing protein [Acidobacteriota bacterium]